MALAAGILWILVGIFYVLWKFGKEELDLGTLGGLLAIAVPIAFICVAYVVALVFKGFAALFLFIPLFIWIIWSKRKDAKVKKENDEINRIFNAIAEPTTQEMDSYKERIMQGIDLTKGEEVMRMRWMLPDYPEERLNGEAQSFCKMKRARELYEQNRRG